MFTRRDGGIINTVSLLDVVNNGRSPNKGVEMLCWFLIALCETFGYEVLWPSKTRVDQLMIKHLSTQGRLDQRGGLHCFWCPNKA
jgi:hypothetical protein